MTMERFRLLEVETTESTNTLAKAMGADFKDATPVVVITDNQTGGRGQRGNSWESEPGANLTFSLVLQPVWLAPAHQFELSMLVSVGIVNALRSVVPPKPLSVKWPNDIYYGDRKICGILIENTIEGARIERSVIGIGLNVNQKEFRSDAPNPISLCHITGRATDRKELLDKVVDNILDMVDQYADDPEPDELTALYNGLLWRNDGRFHKWTEADGTVIEAKIVGVNTDGRLTLQMPDGSEKSYLFKEVGAVL